MGQRRLERRPSLETLVERVDQQQPGAIADDTVPTGFPSLDKLLGGGFRRRDLVVLGGDVGSGKSALALGLALRVARQGSRVAFFSGEMDDERLMERALAIEGRAAVDELRTATLSDQTRAGIGGAAVRLRDLPLTALPLAAPDLETAAGRLDGVRQLALAVVDYLQLVPPRRSMCKFERRRTLRVTRRTTVSWDLQRVTCDAERGPPMAGHSKWKQIKRKKAVADARRGALFTKLIREITIAAKQGGGDPAGNPRLRTAIDAAKAENMPLDNIERAVKKGTGELEGVQYVEVTYEGDGPGGAAIFIEATTANAHSVVAEIRHTFTRHGGNLAAANSVAWMFDRKGQITVDATRADEDATMEAALEAGADDMVRDGDLFLITAPVSRLHAIQEDLKARRIPVQAAEIAMIPKSTVKMDARDAKQLLELIEALEQMYDVAKVSSNFDIDAETMAAVTA